ncbi:hypothetical protein M8J77_005243 [Diaphorina citri]|nr:hypothetical protein M8J77_005243 [Diaphorina citri]
MLSGLKLFVLSIILILVYFELWRHIKQAIQQHNDLLFHNASSPTHVRHKREIGTEGKDTKANKFYLFQRDKLKEKYATFFEELHKSFLDNSCAHMVKMTDTERLGEVLMTTVQNEIVALYQRENEELEKAFELGELPSILKKVYGPEKGMASGDVPLFHKVLKYRYFRAFDRFSLEFFHYLPLVIKNEIRNYFIFHPQIGYDVTVHERVHYLEDKVDEWILRCANHTRMGSIQQDAFYENEFLHEISPEVGEPHLLYEVTEMDMDNTDVPANFTLIAY